MSSPPRRLRRSPPRQPLHERSESQTNERASRTFDKHQILEDETPYLTKPSQILLPSSQRTPPSWLQKSFEGESGSAGADDVDPTKRDRVLGKRWSSDAQQQSHEPWVKLPAGTSLDVAPSNAVSDRGGEDLGDDRTDSPTGIRLVTKSSESMTHPSAEPHYETFVEGGMTSRQPANKDSDNSLSSANTTGTVVVHKSQEGKKRASYSAFPYAYSGRPSSSRSNISARSSPKSSPDLRSDQATQSFAAPPTERSSPSTLSADEQRSRTLTKSDESLERKTVHLQYPIVKPPSFSGSWAMTSETPPPVPSKAAARLQEPWNPRLSTVPSEQSNSGSQEQSRSTMWSGRTTRSISQDLSPRISSNPSLMPTGSSQEVSRLSRSYDSGSSRPSPLSEVRVPPPIKQRDFSGSTIRVVDRSDDRNALNVPPTIPGSSGSATPRTVGTRDRNTTTQLRPSSRASFFRDSIPAWAKTYYARPTSSLSSADKRDSVATDNISLNVWRPRNRAQQRPDRRMSGLAMHPTRPHDLDVDLVRSRRFSPTLSPHLWQDRTSYSHRRSVFKAPSVDEAAEGNSLTKRNAQVLSFAVGFVFPVAWLLAAFLPLPAKPIPSEGKAKQKGIQRGSLPLHDLEIGKFPRELARYENARWWRNVNRTMSLFGLAVIILVVCNCSISMMRLNTDRLQVTLAVTGAT